MQAVVVCAAAAHPLNGYVAVRRRFLVTRLTRRHLLATTGIAALAGCSSGDDGGTTLSGPLDLPTADGRLPLPAEPAALREEARSGGPSKDGIPSIDDPSFIEPDAADFLDPGDPVFGVVSDGVTKAYPQKILVSHEIVNDDLDGTPVSVTYLIQRESPALTVRRECSDPLSEPNAEQGVDKSLRDLFAHQKSEISGDGRESRALN